MQKETILATTHLIKSIRNYFEGEGFLDVMTPPMVKNPGMETHIHPFRVGRAINSIYTDWYLHTSPEFHMKELMANGFEDIFTITHAFRDEPNSDHHRPQFLMLEWYRKNAHYSKIMDDCENLFRFSLQYLKDKNIHTDPNLKNISFQRATVQEIFEETLKIDILNFLDKKDLKELIEINFKDVPLPTMGEELSWDDYYFLLFLNKIEPQLTNYPYLLLYEFPHHLSALSTLKKDDPRVCERFEIYAKGVELCNCFNELTNLKIQKERFRFQKEEKEKLYGYSLTEPEVLYSAMEKGLPTSSGIALGIERLLMVLTEIENPFYN